MPGPRFTDIRHFESIDSTNRYLLDEARAGAPDGVVAVAEHQTAGRGRLGRRWEAPAGANLLASVLLRLDLPVAHRHLASAVVCLAAADAAEAVAGLRLGVKWPNDLVAGDGRKVAGVLAEADVAPAAAASAGWPAIVVGIGINVNWPAVDTELPAELRGSATSLCQQAGHPLDRSDVLEALLGALGPRLADLDTPVGRTRQTGELRARCITIGSPVRVELADGAFAGSGGGRDPGGPSGGASTAVGSGPWWPETSSTSGRLPDGPLPAAPVRPPAFMGLAGDD